MHLAVTSPPPNPNTSRMSHGQISDCSPPPSWPLSLHGLLLSNGLLQKSQSRLSTLLSSWSPCLSPVATNRCWLTCCHCQLNTLNHVYTHCHFLSSHPCPILRFFTSRMTRFLCAPSLFAFGQPVYPPFLSQPHPSPIPAAKARQKLLREKVGVCMGTGCLINRGCSHM